MKKHSSWLFAALLVIAPLVLMQCGTPTTGTCTATNCATGCCDSKNACQLGTATTACGKGGATCGTCSTGQVCKAQVCSANTGGGAGGGAGGGSGVGGGTGGGSGGGTGGGSGGGAGGGTGGGGGGGGAGGGGAGGGVAACEMISSFSQLKVLGASYESGTDGGNEFHNGLITDVDPATSPDGGHAEYYFDVYYFNNATAGAHPLTAITDADCEYCLYLDTGCNAAGTTCAASFLAQAGAINITSNTKNEATGRLTASATNLKFVEWNFSSDTPVPGGKCIQIAQASTDVSWADGGIFQGDGGPP